ncbi:MAG: flippase-like domain-containing protein [Planctomycetes bacterium]|nr:flippase-like domain-containing protein [Planctomycetota bacterium]MCA8935431.1 flippase-like domain-containing protein [Planctomycetota bacterium]
MKKLLRVARRFLPLVFSLAVLVYLFGYRTDPVESWNTARSVKPSMLFIALGLGLMSFVFAAVRLKILVEVLGHKVSLTRMLIYTLVGQFYNSAIPGGSVGGDAIKALYLSNATRSKPQAFAAVLVDRLCGLFMLATLALVMLMPSIQDESMRQAAGVIIVFTGGATAAIIAMTSRRVRKLVPKGLSNKLPFHDTIRAFDEAMQIYRGHKKGLLLALLLSILPQAGWIGMHIAIGQGIGIQLIWTDYAVLIPVAGMVAALPISFGGWGIGEAASVYFFGLRGVPEQPALVLSLSGRLIQLAWAIVGVPLSWALPRPKDIEAAVHGDAVLPDKEVEAATRAKVQSNL